MENKIIVNYPSGTGAKPFGDFILKEYEVIEAKTEDGTPYFVIRDREKPDQEK